MSDTIMLADTLDCLATLHMDSRGAELRTFRDAAASLRRLALLEATVARLTERAPSSDLYAEGWNDYRRAVVRAMS